MKSQLHTVVIDGMGFTVGFNNEGALGYEESLQIPNLERQSPQTPTGELDWNLGWPYPQRDWSLGEQQQFTHEYDELGEAAPRRYAEGHGVDVSSRGSVKLLRSLGSPLAVTTSTCPMCVSKDGATIYAFPVGTSMRKYASGSWTSETITGATSPVTDCINAGAALYIIDSTSGGSRVRTRSSGGTWSQVTPYAALPSDSYDDATAVVYTDGQLFVVTPDEVYAHTQEKLVSDWVGGSIACSHAGGVFWSDGSNRVYLYNGIGTRLIIEDLPTGFQVQSLFSAHSRLWICGQLPDGKRAAYWYAQGQWGSLAWFDAASAAVYGTLAACSATEEHVLFADGKYGGAIRHYSPEGGWSHYLAVGGERIIPYKGLVAGADTIAVAIYSASDGIYIMEDTYVTTGTITGSRTDLGMPAHEKQWFALTATFKPLAAGESIKLEWSKDGGDNWVDLGTVTEEGATEKTYKLDGVSPSAQYRATLGAGTDDATTPELLSVTIRGNPIAQAGGRWRLILDARRRGETLNRMLTTDEASKVRRLKKLAKLQERVIFEDILGDRYDVVIRPFVYNPAIADDESVGSSLTVILDEVAGD